ncbi:MAG: pyridoxamine 5'-phosphate oxidase [Candidatus Dadabacteria bacterium]|nr:MAG: pyridoxamine 5'-phosphate oxidase [Candidatus Dadabacteria bacterium]
MIFRPWLWRSRTLRRQDLLDNPLEQFKAWFNDAKRCLSIEFPEAMALATVDQQLYPHCRMVLLKEINGSDFIFYTNTLSDKGKQLKENPRAALTFYWEPLHRQVRIIGRAAEVESERADRYFATRPRLSQIGAWASKQSCPLRSRAEFDERIKHYEKEFAGRKVPRPAHWSGYRVSPERFEFWQMRPGRLHDRFRYTKDAAGNWQITRIYP